MTMEEIFPRVKTQLVDALGADEDDVKLTSRLQADLNAESIDFLDIVFRLEREFGLKIDRNELFPESILRPNSRSSRKTMSRKSIDSAFRSAWRRDAIVTSPSSTPRASTSWFLTRLKMSSCVMRASLSCGDPI